MFIISDTGKQISIVYIIRTTKHCSFCAQWYSAWGTSLSKIASHMLPADQGQFPVLRPVSPFFQFVMAQLHGTLNVSHICTTTFSGRLLLYSVFSYLVFSSLVTFALIIVSKLFQALNHKFSSIRPFFFLGIYFQDLPFKDTS